MSRNRFCTCPWTSYRICLKLPLHKKGWYVYIYSIYMKQGCIYRTKGRIVHRTNTVNTVVARSYKCFSITTSSKTIRCSLLSGLLSQRLRPHWSSDFLYVYIIYKNSSLAQSQISLHMLSHFFLPDETAKQVCVRIQILFLVASGDAVRRPGTVREGGWEPRDRHGVAVLVERLKGMGCS